MHENECLKFRSSLMERDVYKKPLQMTVRELNVLLFKREQEEDIVM